MNPILSLALLGNLVQAQGPGTPEQVDGVAFKALVDQARAVAEGVEGIPTGSIKTGLTGDVATVGADTLNRKARRRQIRQSRGMPAHAASLQSVTKGNSSVKTPVSELGSVVVGRVNQLKAAPGLAGIESISLVGTPLGLQHSESELSAEWGTLPALETLTSGGEARPWPVLSHSPPSLKSVQKYADIPVLKQANTSAASSAVTPKVYSQLTEAGKKLSSRGAVSRLSAFVKVGEASSASPKPNLATAKTSDWRAVTKFAVPPAGATRFTSSPVGVATDSGVQAKVQPSALPENSPATVAVSEAPVSASLGHSLSDSLISVSPSETNSGEQRVTKYSISPDIKAGAPALMINNQSSRVIGEGHLLEEQSLVGERQNDDFVALAPDVRPSFALPTPDVRTSYLEPERALQSKRVAQTFVSPASWGSDELTVEPSAVVADPMLSSVPQADRTTSGVVPAIPISFGKTIHLSNVLVQDSKPNTSLPQTPTAPISSASTASAPTAPTASASTGSTAPIASAPTGFIQPISSGAAASSPHHVDTGKTVSRHEPVELHELVAASSRPVLSKVSVIQGSAKVALNPGAEPNEASLTSVELTPTAASDLRAVANASDIVSTDERGFGDPQVIDTDRVVVVPLNPKVATPSVLGASEEPIISIRTSESDNVAPAVSDAVERMNPFASPDHVVRIGDDVSPPEEHRRIVHSDELVKAHDQSTRVIRIEESPSQPSSRVLRIDENGIIHGLEEPTSEPTSDVVEPKLDSSSTDQQFADPEVLPTQQIDATRGVRLEDQGPLKPEATLPAEPSSSVRPLDGGDVVAPELEVEEPPPIEMAVQDEAQNDLLEQAILEQSQGVEAEAAATAAAIEQGSEELGAPRDPAGLNSEEIAVQDAEESAEAELAEVEMLADDSTEQSYQDQDSKEESWDELSTDQAVNLEPVIAETISEPIKSVREVRKTPVANAPSGEIPLEELVDISEAELADLAEQSVRVEIDQDLAVEVAMTEKGVEITLDGNRSSLNSLKGSEAEMERALRDSGHDMSSFSERDRDSGAEKRRENSSRSRFAKRVDPKSLVQVRRGTYINTVA